MLIKKMLRFAIVYDFDGTLAKGNIQENSFLPEIGIKKEDFWKDVKKITKDNQMDETLAYMYMLILKAKEAGNIKIDKAMLKKHGKSVKYFSGVETYFKRINAFAKKQGVLLEHYIVSAGIKEMLEGTSIAKNFKYIFASSFKYDKSGIVEWPAVAVNYTTKTQYLFRINKGIYNIWDNESVNRHMPDDERVIPFENIVYIGDGFSDVPAMKIIEQQGGTSIGVYDPKNVENKFYVQDLIKRRRISYVAKADYKNNGEIDVLLKSIIKQAGINNLFLNSF